MGGAQRGGGAFAGSGFKAKPATNLYAISSCIVLHPSLGPLQIVKRERNREIWLEEIYSVQKREREIQQAYEWEAYNDNVPNYA